MTLHRADIFNSDAIKMMETGTIKQMQWYLDETKTSNSIKDEDFVDLMAIRMRFPNYAGIDQARADSFIINYMPFLQPSVLRNVFHIPMHLKKKGRLFRQIIVRHCPDLTSFPLVKGGTTYPFWFSTVPAHLWTLAKKKLSKPFIDTRIYAMLEMLKEYSLDLVHSQEIQTYPFYDIRKVKSLVERYYNGEQHLVHEIDWWLSFEFWRQSMKSKK